MKSLSIAIPILMAMLVSGCSLQLGDREIKGEAGEAVLSYASPVAERCLQALSSNDYAAFSRDFSEAMLNAMPEGIMRSTRQDVIPVIGDFVSLGSARVYETEGGRYVKVVYSAEFGKESGILATFTFLKDDPGHKIQGLWITSPKLGKAG